MCTRHPLARLRQSLFEAAPAGDNLLQSPSCPRGFPRKLESLCPPRFPCEGCAVFLVSSLLSISHPRSLWAWTLVSSKQKARRFRKALSDSSNSFFLASDYHRVPADRLVQ